MPMEGFVMMMPLFTFMALLIAIHLCEGVASTKKCRCLPGSDCWPSASKWQDLNASVDGHLVVPRPTAAPCHDPTYDKVACQNLRANWFVSSWRVNNVGSMQYANWEANGNQTCLPFNSYKSDPCYQGSVPAYAVDVRRIEHIQIAVRFATSHNLRLVVKSTGHDQLGRSTAPGALLIWLRNFNGYTLHAAGFTPDGCQGNTNDDVDAAITVDGGALWMDINKTLVDHGFVVAKGIVTDVGAAGGFVQGGGHGPLAPSIGLGADNIVQVVLVTADGEIRTASRCQNPDLFWALRGGGGGTFGVVASVTHKCHRDVNRYIGTRVYFYSNHTESLANLTSVFLQLHPSLSLAGWAGYFTFTPNQLNINYLLVNATLGDPNYNPTKDFTPLLYEALSLPQVVLLDYTFKAYTSLESWRIAYTCGVFPNSGCMELVGSNTIIGSRLIPARLLANTSATTLLVHAFLQVVAMSKLAIIGHFVAGGAVSMPVDNAVNPAWRSALLHTIWGHVYMFNMSQSYITSQRAIIDQATALITDLTPDSGAYINEASYNEPNWQASLFGKATYAKLKRIKEEVDPQSLFVCHHCVGSDEWTEDLNCPIHSQREKVNPRQQ